MSQKRRKTKEAESEDEPSDEDFEDGKKEKEELSEDDESPPQQPKARRSKTTKSKPKPEASEEDEKKPELLRDKDEEKVLDGAEGDFDVHNDVDGDVKEEDADEPPQVGKRGVTAASRGKGGRPKSAQGKGRKKGGSEPLGAELSGGATVKKQRASKGTGKRGRGGKAGGKGAGRKAGNKNDEVGHIDEHDYGDNDQGTAFLCHVPSMLPVSNCQRVPSCSPCSVIAALHCCLLSKDMTQSCVSCSVLQCVRPDNSGPVGTAFKIVHSVVPFFPSLYVYVLCSSSMVASRVSK